MRSAIAAGWRKSKRWSSAMEKRFDAEAVSR
jgi:hypothetical protein